MAVLANYDEILTVVARDLKDIFFVSSTENRVVPQGYGLMAFDGNSLKNRIQQHKFIEQDPTLEPSFNEVIDKIVSIMNEMASLSFKGSKFLEPSEVKTIQESLENYDERSEKIAEIKKELEQFEEQIQINYSRRIFEQKKEKEYCEEKIEMMENAKKQTMKSNLLKTLWPYDMRTKRFDCKIASLKTRMAKCIFSIEQLTGMRPAASEKDILLFQIQLKNKFTAQASII